MLCCLLSIHLPVKVVPIDAPHDAALCAAAIDVRSLYEMEVGLHWVLGSPPSGLDFAIVNSLHITYGTSFSKQSSGSSSVIQISVESS